MEFQYVPDESMRNASFYFFILTSDNYEYIKPKYPVLNPIYVKKYTNEIIHVICHLCLRKYKMRAHAFKKSFAGFVHNLILEYLPHKETCKTLKIPKEHFSSRTGRFFYLCPYVSYHYSKNY